MIYQNKDIIDSKIMMLGTEGRNPNSVNIDRVSTREMLEMINNEDMTVPQKVRKAIPQIEKAIEYHLPKMQKGGRLIYVGAGTSARLGFVDAAELPPSYHVEHGLFICLMAGGRDCVFRAQEGKEDEAESAVRDLKEIGFNSLDTVCAVAASGRTPYCMGALKYAAEIGAGRIAIACNKGSEIGAISEIAIEMDIGPEVVMGSTRMKAASAQKLAMNMFSTGLMIRDGRTLSNLMIPPSNDQIGNSKVSNRAPRRFAEVTGNPDLTYAMERLEEVNGCLRCAIIRELSGCDIETAKTTCDNCDGNIKKALKMVGAEY